MTSLQSQMDAVFKRKVEANHEKAIRITGLQVMREIVLNTPVKTGRARSNWNADVNTVDASITDQLDPNTDGSGKVLNALIKFKTGMTLFLSNNLPYIKRLNEGYSKQAPAMFVDKAVMTGTRQAREIIKRDLK